MTLQEFVKNVLTDLSPIVGEGAITFDVYVWGNDRGHIMLGSNEDQHLTFSVEMTLKLAAPPQPEKEKEQQHGD